MACSPAVLGIPVPFGAVPAILYAAGHLGDVTPLRELVSITPNPLELRASLRRPGRLRGCGICVTNRAGFAGPVRPRCVAAHELHSKTVNRDRPSPAPRSRIAFLWLQQQ